MINYGRPFPPLSPRLVLPSYLEFLSEFLVHLRATRDTDTTDTPRVTSERGNRGVASE
jgi:hypothetical protein